MQIIKLMGGLGNQMFEYVFGQVLSQKTGKEVLYDLSWFEEVKSYVGPVAKRAYELGNFNIDLKFASKEQCEKCIDEQKIRVSKLPGILRKLFKKEKYKIVSRMVFEKTANEYEPALFSLDGDNYFIGYFQTEKYFKEYRDVILQDFSLKVPLDEKNKEMLTKIQSLNSVSLHVRRGDYVNLQEVHGLCTLEYYQSAIEYIASKIENPHFFMFSDDIAWVVENLKINYPYTVVDFNDASTNYYDLELMKNCKHNIIANSSFSWWGAWLNDNPDKIVVAPSKWFATDDMSYSDIIPESWIKI